MRRWAVPALLTALSLVVALLTSGTSARGAPTTTSRSSPLPLFAYYYQWFDVRSWNRAKIDYPALGRYSSDDRQVMTRHIREAKTAGVTGFIVSWKDTPTDTRRLHSLADVAAREHFSLAMIYQGLDFNRKPLPVVKVAADFKMFAAQFAQDPVFYRMGGKPLTIWSGTWAYSHHDVASVTGAVRPALLVLSTEKSVAGYQRISDVTDGDAYYWSSVNPTTNRTYAAKLRDMSSAVHADGKYWIAPVAPGFDARLVGGTKTVPRGDGATLRTEYNTAMESSPDALGLISWNEFSENTYVEPSERLGRRYLDVLADLTNTSVPTPSTAVDSSDSPVASAAVQRWPTVAALIGLPVLLVLAVAVLARRRRRAPGTRPAIVHHDPASEHRHRLARNAGHRS
ncbi:MAG: hypothetical protein QOF87_4548 [Pseudonocardiales bacterium]|nr:hypothetical protein [Pseudonocardiales bacterium]